MFEQALTAASALPAGSRDALLARLDEVCEISREIGCGVGDNIDSSMAEYRWLAAAGRCDRG